MDTRTLHRRLIGFGAGVIVVAAFSASAGAETHAAPSRAAGAEPQAAVADVRPIIGRPTANPARPVAESRVVYLDEDDVWVDRWFPVPERS